ncbi:hypothetical protein Nepgr_007592 [Nepenthes gracilis]|uniref:Uncharacterized protein n=1 Tax=Nepenthes gracilis TaxID=150966 RepID=A0AAD3S758_NEPGR|nr:hypothetical protein Nepgr_007592 [Nepenthes gracilis]
MATTVDGYYTWARAMDCREQAKISGSETPSRGLHYDRQIQYSQTQNGSSIMYWLPKMFQGKTARYQRVGRRDKKLLRQEICCVKEKGRWGDDMAPSCGGRSARHNASGRARHLPGNGVSRHLSLTH